MLQYHVLLDLGGRAGGDVVGYTSLLGRDYANQVCVFFVTCLFPSSQREVALEDHCGQKADGVQSYLTGQGGNLRIALKQGLLFANTAQVVIPDVLVSNGVVHVIDK